MNGLVYFRRNWGLFTLVAEYHKGSGIGEGCGLNLGTNLHCTSNFIARNLMALFWNIFFLIRQRCKYLFSRVKVFTDVYFQKYWIYINRKLFCVVLWLLLAIWNFEVCCKLNHQRWTDLRYCENVLKVQIHKKLKRNNVWGVASNYF